MKSVRQLKGSRIGSNDGWWIAAPILAISPARAKIFRVGKYLLPHEQPYRSSRNDDRFRGRWPSLVVLLGIPVAAYVWHGLAYGTWGWTLGMLLFCTFGGTGFWYDTIAGITKSNEGIFERYTHPRKFWGTLALPVILYLVGLTGLILPDHYRSSWHLRQHEEKIRAAAEGRAPILEPEPKGRVGR
jgi:hypothetical protein